MLELPYPGHQIVDNSGTIPLMLSHYEFSWHSDTKSPRSAVVTIGQELAAQRVFAHKDDTRVFKDLLAPEDFLPQMRRKYNTSIISMNNPR